MQSCVRILGLAHREDDKCPIRIFIKYCNEINFKLPYLAGPNCAASQRKEGRMGGSKWRKIPSHKLSFLVEATASDGFICHRGCLAAAASWKTHRKKIFSWNSNFSSKVTLSLSLLLSHFLAHSLTLSLFHLLLSFLLCLSLSLSLFHLLLSFFLTMSVSLSYSVFISSQSHLSILLSKFLSLPYF